MQRDVALYIQNKEVQEKIFIVLTEYNLQVLKIYSTVDTDTPVSTIGGILFVAHLLGVTNAAAWRDGSLGRDAFGTKGDEYFKLGAVI